MVVFFEIGRFGAERLGRGVNVEESSHRHGWRRTGHFIWVLSTAVIRHDIFSLAAVIAFYAFFSLFPLLLLAIYALSTFLPEAHIQQVMLTVLRPYFPNLPEARAVISSNIEQLSGGARVGLLSAVVLTWSATSGFLALQQALDVIWAVPEQRSYWTRRLVSYFMLLLLLLLTLSSSFVMAIYPSIHRLGVAKPLVHAISVVHGVSRILFPLSLFLGFLIGFRYLPSRRTHWDFLIPGALVATAALDVGRVAFAWYVAHLFKYQVIYGGLTAVMLVILWMYIGSILMLFGAEVAVALEQVTAVT